MNLALFDFDGTITEGDTLTPFVRLTIPVRRRAAGYLVLGPVVLGYRVGAVSASRLRTTAVGFALKGVPAATIRDIGVSYAAQVLPRTIQPAARERLEWHRAQGDEIVVVSASLDAYLRPWCESEGVGCVCSELEEDDGMLTGRYRNGDCAGAAKAAMVQEKYQLSWYATVYAYGDTDEDREMLALAQRKYYRWEEGK